VNVVQPAVVDPDVPAGVGATARSALDAMGFPHAGGTLALLPGGASNCNLLLSTGAGRFVVRLAEQDVARFGIDRARGLEAHRVAAAAGVAPELCAALPNGHCVTRFADGPVLDARRIREPGMLARVGRALHALHHAGTIAGEFSVFEDLRRYAAIAAAEGLSLPPDFDVLMRCCDAVERVVAGARVARRLCHNDVQLQNFIVGDERLWILDFEYAGMGTPYFDLAMVSVNAELTDGEEAELTIAYFGDPTPADRARVRLLTLLSAMREATWAVIAKPVLGGLSWDYDAWAGEYYERARRFVAGGAYERSLEQAA
jgi:thiamine kinase-like enzyme